MNKILWLGALIVFVFVTVFVVSLDTTQTHRVQFSNQDFAIKNEGNEVVNNSIHGTNANVKFSDSKFTNKGISATDTKLNLNSTKVGLSDSSNLNVKDVSIDNSSDFNSKNVKFKDNSKYSYQGTEFGDKAANYGNQDLDFETQSTGFKNSNPIEYKNLDTEHLDNVLANAKNYKYQSTDVSNKPFQQKSRYQYKNIDWNTWRSEFVNKILDDSLTIRSLDTYGQGAWFFYSFDVSSEGEISNITIKSMYLKDEDKKRVAQLIQSYQYKEITVFPANTNRKSARVSAVMMLSNETKHSSPNDFNDFEQIRLKIK
ncbi:hypothetical protein J6A64_03605 [bacterium]|nr:hypothetical protein [bacterium]